MTIDRSFVDGMFWRILLLGAVAGVIIGGVVSIRFGYSVALGALVAAGSLRITAAAVQRLVEAVVEEGARPSPVWAIALAVKLLALFAAVALALVVLDAHPVGFVIGFKMLLPALGWQAVRNPEPLMGSGDEDAHDTESR